MRMDNSGLARSPIAIAISAMREVAGSIYPAVANLITLLMIFAAAGSIELDTSSHLPDRDCDVEFYNFLQIFIKIERMSLPLRTDALFCFCFVFFMKNLCFN